MRTLEFVMGQFATSDAAVPVAVDGQNEARRQASSVIAEYRERFGRADPPGMTHDQWRAWVDARRQAEAQAIDALFKIALAVGALLLPLKYGNGFICMHPDVRRRGAWRTTTFTEVMEPSGHMEWNTPQEAAHQLLHSAAASAILREPPGL